MKNNEQNSYEKLTQEQQIAIDLRLSGVTYQEISKTDGIKVTEHTLRTWFMAGGVCREAYEQKKKERAEERAEFFNSVDQQINNLAMSAILTIKKAIEEGNVNASFKVLELAELRTIIKKNKGWGWDLSTTHGVRY